MSTHFQPVPVSGWDASRPLDLMGETDAHKLINVLPKEETIKFRKGSLKLNSSPVAAEVETMATHRDVDGTETLVCATDEYVLSMNTSTGNASIEGSGFKNARWQTVNFNDRLLMVNGQDTPQEFDGSTLQNYTATISGVTADDLLGVTMFKGRCIYWENNASKFWYAAAGSYGGALTSFPLSLVAQKGGYVVECFTWTLDGGEGVDDIFVILMSTGETLAYQGSDPSAFSLIGKFSLGKPVGTRCSTQLGGDRIVITEDGFVNLSTALQVGRTSDKGNAGSKIINAAKQATDAWSGNYGWECLYHDKESLLIINIPINVDASDSDQNRYEQYCMNTNTGAWCKFKGWDAITFTEVDGVLYMGGSDGHIRTCFTGANDDGVAIKYIVTPAFTLAGHPNRKKQLTYVTIITNFIDKTHIGIGGLSDFEETPKNEATIPDKATGTLAEWDDSDWDEDYWGEVSSSKIRTYNIPVAASGYSLSCKIKIISEIQTAEIYSLRYTYKNLRSI